MTDSYEPMLASTVGSIPKTDEWSWEIKFDGIRAGAIVKNGNLTLISRRGTDMTAWFPQLASIGSCIGAKRAVIDGEIIAGDGSVASFNELLRLSRSRGRASIALPLTFVAFDVLSLNGLATLSLSLEERRQTLQRVIREANGIVISRVYADGHALFKAALSHGLEGVVGKRQGQPYSIGRSRNWIKVKAPDAAARHEWKQ